MSFGIYVLIFTYRTNMRVGDYKLEKYEYELVTFPSDKILGPIDTAEIAKENAEEVWNEMYGEENIKNEKPYRVSFDEKSETWMVNGSLPPLHLGGVAYIIMQKSDGKVLAVWHTK
jgi:hypothetical protein